MFADKIHIGFDLEVYEVIQDNYEYVDLNDFSLSFLTISIDEKKVRTTKTSKSNSKVLRFKKNIFHKILGFAKLQHNPRFIFNNEKPIATDEYDNIHSKCD